MTEKQVVSDFLASERKAKFAKLLLTYAVTAAMLCIMYALSSVLTVMFVAVYYMMAIAISAVLIVGTLGLIFFDENHLLKKIFSVNFENAFDIINKIAPSIKFVLLAGGILAALSALAYAKSGSRQAVKGRVVFGIVLSALSVIASIILFIGGGK